MDGQSPTMNRWGFVMNKILVKVFSAAGTKALNIESNMYRRVSVACVDNSLTRELLILIFLRKIE